MATKKAAAKKPAAAAKKPAAKKAAAKKPAAKKPAEKAAVQAECPHPPEAAAGEKPKEDWTLTRGEPLKGAPAVALTELLAKPQAHDGQTVRVDEGDGGLKLAAAE